MEENDSETLDAGDSPGICVNLEYYLDNNEKKEGQLEFGSYNDKIEKISYEEITYSFYEFLKYNSNIESDDIELNNIKYEFIRYFDGEGWILLNEKEIIFFDNELTSAILKIMIKATIIC